MSGECGFSFSFSCKVFGSEKKKNLAIGPKARNGDRFCRPHGRNLISNFIRKENENSFEREEHF